MISLALEAAGTLLTERWQARRDSNPHHPDLESGALAVRATGLQKASYFVSLWSVWILQKGQYFRNDSLSGVFRLFFVEV
jgi:hypothetical protein